MEPLVGELSRVAADLAKAMGRHMAREESEVLPVLMRTLCPAEQRHMVWRILLAMPLRLLERVMPWVAGEGGRLVAAGGGAGDGYGTVGGVSGLGAGDSGAQGSELPLSRLRFWRMLPR